MRYIFNLLIASVFLMLTTSSYSQIKPKSKWWMEEPYRLIQTNLREIDAIGFDVDAYVNSLKDIGANVVLINVGGIVANYYTDLDFHFQNPHLKYDLIKIVIDKLHKEGIRVIGRFDFSKLNEQYAVMNPDWQYKSVKGELVNYNGQVHMCVNGGYQQEYAKEILRESLNKFPLDGVFFNMTGYQVHDYSHNYIGICQSGACKKRFKEWSNGLTLPTVESIDDPVFLKYKLFKEETTSELNREKFELIKSFGDHIAILNFNEFGTDLYRSESHAYGALTGDMPWEYNASDNVKRTVGSYKDKQSSNTAVHFVGYPARHSANSKWITERRLVEDIMHGGGLDFYCIGRLDNLEDRRILENVKDVFQFHKKNERYFHKTYSDNKVLVLNEKINPYTGSNENKGIFTILSQNHILFDVMEHNRIDKGNLPRTIDSYDVVILPEIGKLSDAQCQVLDRYVENGGKVLATGFTSVSDELGNPKNKIRLKSLGVKRNYEIFEKKEGTYFRIFEKNKSKLGSETFKDLDLVYAWEKGLLCEPVESATGYLGFIPPAMIGPPEKCYYEEVTEKPGIIHNTYEKGETAFITFRLGALYNFKRHHGHADLFIATLEKLLGYKQDLETNTHAMVEINKRIGSSGKFEWLALLNHSGQTGSGFLEPLPIYDVNFSFSPEKKVKSVKSLQSGHALSFKENNGKIDVSVPKLASFDIVLVEYDQSR
jgi:hypothetical protein